MNSPEFESNEIKPRVEADPLNRSWYELVWNIFIHRDHERIIPPYGSAAEDFINANLKRDLDSWLKTQTLRLIQSEEILAQVETVFESLKRNLSRKDFGEHIKEQLLLSAEKLDEIWEYSDFSIEFIKKLNSVHSLDCFYLARVVNDFLSAGGQFLGIQKGVLSALRHQIHSARAQEESLGLELKKLKNNRPNQLSQVKWKLNLELT